MTSDTYTLEKFTCNKRIYYSEDSFYDEGNNIREIWAKHAALEPLQLVDTQSKDGSKLFYCNIHGCSSSFTNTFEYENHYNSVHKNECKTCKRVFPSYRLVDIHVLEAHDALFKAMSQRKKMYDCLVEGCTRKFWNDHVRKLHLVDLHKYPKDFKFHSHKKSKNKKPPNAEMETNDPSDDFGMNVVLMDLEQIRVGDQQKEPESNANIPTDVADVENNAPNTDFEATPSTNAPTKLKYSYTVTTKNFSFGQRKGRR